MYNVFLVDDEPWALTALKNMIEWIDYGFVICGEAGDGTQALGRIERILPDLIISDIRMPELDGLELLETIRERKWDIEVLLVSGYTDFEYAREALRHGCQGYMVKPVAENDLIEYLKKVKGILDLKRAAVNNVVLGSEKKEVAFQSEKFQVQNMIRYIQEHFSEGLTLQVLAEEFKMSDSYISSLIKKKTGKGFGEHLTGLRIQKAQEYLRTTNDSIEEIAIRVGYPDYYYFTKVYKKATGISPTAYRKQL